MKLSDTTTIFLVALLLASPLASAEPQYPAANFQPIIITQDADLIAKHGQAAAEREAAGQAKLAKRNQSAVTETAAKPAEVSGNDEVSSSNGNFSSQKESSSMENFPIALVVLALAGFVFWSTKRPSSNSKAENIFYPASSLGSASGTGVAKYVKEIELSAKKAAGTGVTQYLRALESVSQKVSETRVDKYIKGADLSSKKPTETGVEKYLKSKA